VWLGQGLSQSLSICQWLSQVSFRQLPQAQQKPTAKHAAPSKLARQVETNQPVRSIYLESRKLRLDDLQPRAFPARPLESRWDGNPTTTRLQQPSQLRIERHDNSQRHEKLSALLGHLESAKSGGWLHMRHLANDGAL
jgi:SRSO17 transposase